jgi:hypothetical protein
LLPRARPVSSNIKLYVTFACAPSRRRYTRSEGKDIVDALAEKLDARLREWKPETAAEARERISEVIDLADHDILDLARSRAVEQEVIDLLDEPPTR